MGTRHEQTPEWERAAALARLREDDARVLLLLARLPLATADQLRRLLGLANATRLGARLARLAGDGLVARIPLSRPGASPGTPRRGPLLGLWHLTDGGLAVVALLWGREPAVIAASHGLGGAALARRLLHAPAHLALLDAAALLAGARPGRPTLVEWCRPWRGTGRRPGTGAAAPLALPALARLAWRGVGGAWEGTARVLLADLPARPPGRWGATLAAWAGEHAKVGMPDEPRRPRLLIATEGGARAAEWAATLAAACRAVGCGDDWLGLGLCDLVNWEGDVLGHGGDSLGRYAPPAAPITEPDLCPPDAPVAGVRRGATAPRPVARGHPFPPPGAPLPTLGTPGARARAALALDGDDWRLLELLAARPFLRAEWLARWLGWARGRLAAVGGRLVAADLARLVPPDELDPARLARAWRRGLTAADVRARLAEWRPAELTGAGLEALAGRDGLGPAEAADLRGWAGGGPGAPFGPRAALLANFAHTDGLYWCFMDLAQMADEENERAGLDGAAADALTCWLTGRGCGRGRFRPDGYGVYRRRGVDWPFFLEYDRGTERACDYVDKFDTYAAEAAGVASTLPGKGTPTVLVVMEDPSAEGRLAVAARGAGLTRGGRLPVLLTTRERAERAPDGLLGAIWRNLADEGVSRDFWVGRRPRVASPASAGASRPPWAPRGGGDGRRLDEGREVNIAALMRRSPDYRGGR